LLSIEKSLSYYEAFSRFIGSGFRSKIPGTVPDKSNLLEKKQARIRKNYHLLKHI